MACKWPNWRAFRRRWSSARALLAQLESGKANGASVDALPLFSFEAPEPHRPDALRDALASLDPDALSPREALDALYALKRAAQE